MVTNLYIDRIILEGIDLPAHHYPAFQQAVEVELARLFAQGGLQAGLAEGGALREAHGGEVEGATSLDPAGFGRQVARAVYGGIGR